MPSINEIDDSVSGKGSECIYIKESIVNGVRKQAKKNKNAKMRGARINDDIRKKTKKIEVIQNTRMKQLGLNEFID